jgi:hypothetical protein
MRVCKGPLHPQGVMLPLEDFNIYRSGPRQGKPIARCKACHLELERTRYQRKTGGGLVPLRKLLPFLIELVQRIGLVETSRRTELGVTTISQILRQKNKYVQKRTFQKVAVVLHEVRRTDERRHRFSIQHGASARQRPEKLPRSRRDLHVIPLPKPDWESDS